MDFRIQPELRYSTYYSTYYSAVGTIVGTMVSLITRGDGTFVTKLTIIASTVPTIVSTTIS